MRAHFKERSADDFMRDLSNDAYAVFFFFVLFQFSLQKHNIYVVGTRVNSLNLLR